MAQKYAKIFKQPKNRDFFLVLWPEIGTFPVVLALLFGTFPEFSLQNHSEETVVGEEFGGHLLQLS